MKNAAAGLMIVGFPGTEPTPELEALLDAGVAGVVLFRRNIEDATQLAALTRRLKERAGRPLLVAIDQEGGRVARLRGAPFTELPPMRRLGELADEALCEQVGALLAAELRAVGVDWDYAPVLDVDSNEDNPVIGDRSFGREPALVGRLGVALARGLEAGGVASCAKHFPGHGDTTEDSHNTLPVLPHDLTRLREVELPPFVDYARAGLASIMTAHVVFEAVDPGVPATLSGRALVDVLRNEVGFRGVVVSDDLEMKAIAETVGVAEAAVRGVAAGVDCFLVCHHAEAQWSAIEAITRAVGSGRLSQDRLDEAHGRVRGLVERFARPAGASTLELGGGEHRALVARLGLTLEGKGDEQVGSDPTEAA